MARPLAPRFEVTVLRDKSVSDNAQVPANGARVNFYRAGATVSATVTVPASATGAPVSVFDLGQVAVGDTVRIGVGTGTLSVSGLATNQVRVANPTSSPITLASGTRLVPTTNRPNVYLDPLCSVSAGNFLIADPTGRASAYLPNNRMDYDVEITGQPLRLYVDGAGMLGRSDRAWNDLRDFGGDLQAALDALPPEGGTLFVPRGTWPVTSGVAVNTPNVTIMGEQACSVLKAQTANLYDLIAVNQTGFQMRDITLDGAATAQDPAGKSCLYVRGKGTSGNLILDVSLRNVRITGGPRYGLNMEDVIIMTADGCHFDGNKGIGVRIDNGTIPAGPTTTHFISCTFSQNGGQGCVVNNVTSLSFRACSFQGNQGGTTAQGNALDAKGGNRVDVLCSCFGAANTLTAPGQLVLITGMVSAVIDACWFDGGPVVAKQPVQAVRFTNAPSSRLSSCVGKNIGSFLCSFDFQSLDCVEFGNAEIDRVVVRMSFEEALRAQRLAGASRWSLGIQSVRTAGLPTGADALPASLAFAVETKALRVWDGANWRTVGLVP